MQLIGQNNGFLILLSLIHTSSKWQKSPYPFCNIVCNISHSKNIHKICSTQTKKNYLPSNMKYNLHLSTFRRFPGSGGNGNTNKGTTESETPQCNCRHHPPPQTQPQGPPPLPPFMPAFAAPPPHPLVHRRSKSSERLNTRMSLATPPTPLITPNTAALIGPFIFYQPQEISRYVSFFIISVRFMLDLFDDSTIIVEFRSRILTTLPRSGWKFINLRNMIYLGICIHKIDHNPSSETPLQNY